MTALTPIVRMYERELHSKHLLVHELDRLIHAEERSISVTPTDSSSSSSLLPLRSADAFVAPTSVHALDLYVSSWSLEPELDSDVLATTQHLWESQLPGK